MKTESQTDKTKKRIKRVWVAAAAIVVIAVVAVATVLVCGNDKEECKQADLLMTSGELNGHGYVDLGLSVKWATCNIGADQGTDFGHFIAWGDTVPKRSYDEENSPTWEKVFGEIGGDPATDPATYNWGDGWRLPTRTEMQELLDWCDWQWSVLNGHKGVLVVSRKNRNYIFLPASGSRYNTSLLEAGEYGFYWTSSPEEGDKENKFSMSLMFYKGTQELDGFRRDGGRNIRPVTE